MCTHGRHRYTSGRYGIPNQDQTLMSLSNVILEGNLQAKTKKKKKGDQSKIVPTEKN